MSSVLPPGCWFRPSEDQLLAYYLTNKNRRGGASGAAAAGASGNNGYDFIRELNLYDYDPSQLLENACYDYSLRGRRRRHWYCYAGVRALAEGSRRAKGGFWIMKGRARGISLPGGNALIGSRTKFVFYSGESDKCAVRTDWILYEYALVDHVEASFVLCRVFIKSHFGNNAKVQLNSSADILEKISRDLLRLSCDIDYQVTARLVPAIGLSFPSSIERKERVGTFESTARNNLDTESDQRTPEDDFIELDDLKD